MRSVRAIGRCAHGYCVVVVINKSDLILFVEDGCCDVPAKRSRTAESHEVSVNAAVRCVIDCNDRTTVGGGERIIKSDGIPDRGDVVVHTAFFDIELQVRPHAKKV